jgi:hypothetical protein
MLIYFDEEYALRSMKLYLKVIVRQTSVPISAYAIRRKSTSLRFDLNETPSDAVDFAGQPINVISCSVLFRQLMLQTRCLTHSVQSFVKQRPLTQRLAGFFAASKLNLRNAP